MANSELPAAEQNHKKKNIETTRLPKQRFVFGGPAPIAVAGGLILGIRLRFHNHAPKQLATLLVFHQPAAHQIRSHHLCRAAKEGFGEDWEVLSEGRGGYGSGLETFLTLAQPL